MREIIDLRGARWTEFLGARTRRARSPEVAGDDLAAILFTSGTTGRPKGAMLTHRRRCARTTRGRPSIGLRDGDRYLIVNPFFHSFGLNAGIVACLVNGATIIPHAVFDVDAVMTRAAEERVSMLPGPPTVYQTILDHPRLAEFDMSSLRLAVTGAAPVPVELIRRMRAELGFETIVTGYGLTEATGIATMCRHDDDPETISTTSGRAIPGVEVLVVDEKGDEVPRGEPGEVVIRGYNVMQGFIHDPEATAEAIDADGWLHTGDVGVMDDARLPPHHRPHEGHVHRRRLQRVSRRDREHDQRPSRRSGRSQSSAFPTRAWARSATRSWCPGSTRRSRPTS